MFDPNAEIQAVDVFLQRRKTREYVGRLENKKSKFIFNYAESYIYGTKSISLGPDLPLSKRRHVSDKLFATFEDRIPSAKNPAFKEYCKAVGISPDEKNPLVLVATLGSRGPSSFIFTPVRNDEFGKNELIKFRKNLGLSIREFAEVFDFAPATIQRIESGKSSGKDALKRLELYVSFPETALYELQKNGYKISDDQRIATDRFLKLQRDQNKY